MPQSIDTERYRDLHGRAIEPIVRRIGVCLLLIFVVAALAGAVGQPASDQSVSGASAAMTLSSPERVRGGLIYQARIDVLARRRLAAPRFVFDRGWFDGLTINTTIPDPSMALNRDGQVVLEYGALAPGERMHVWIQVQVNPTAIGGRTQTVTLDDGQTPVATLRHHLTILP